MITIYFKAFDRRLDNSEFHRLLSFLPETMRAKTLRFRKWEDAHAHLIGKLLLKKGLEDLGYNHDLSQVKLSSYNRPYINSAIDFNISHAGNYVICAFSTIGRIGIDIEKVDIIDVNDFHSQWNEEEWNEIITSKNIYRQFYTFWTIKEAVVKADGRGLSIPFENIKIKKGKGKVNCDGVCWEIKEVFINEDYICYLASKAQISEIKIQKIETNF